MRRTRKRETHAFGRRLWLRDFFGIGAALLGLVIYSAIAIFTGWQIGYIAILVALVDLHGYAESRSGLWRA